MALFTEADRLTWVSDGQKVTLDIGGGRGLACVVVQAHGHHARVRSLTTTGDWVGWEAIRPVEKMFPEVTPELRAKLKGRTNGKEGTEAATGSSG